MKGTVQTGRAWARLLCVVVVLAVSGWSEQASAETYVILSLVGDRLTLIGLGAQVGSRIDQSPRQIVPVTGSGFDDFAVRVVDASIAKARPSASVVALRASDPNLYKMRDSWLDSDAVEIKELMAFLPDSIGRSPESWLILIAPYRDELELKTDRDLRGVGKVAGLGLYVDGMTRMWDYQRKQIARGYLGVFAHFQIVLINLQTGTSAAQKRVVLGTTYAAAEAEDRTVWNALTEAQKVKALQALIKQGIEESLPSMLSSKKL